MKHLGDITKIHKPPVVDCITFGSPCQDLSIAGKRAGLAGERSGLFMEAVRIIKEMEEQSGGLGPTFAIWENVPGAFSSNGGKDFHAVLEELARIKEPEVSIPRPERGKWAKAGFICGNGWSIAWRTIDAQFWGVPQRRRRIALVLDLRGQRAGEVLFERTGVSGNPEPSIPPWKGIARNPSHVAAGHDRVVEGPGAYTLKIRSGCEGGGKGPLVQTEKSATLSTLQDQTLFVCASPYQDTIGPLMANSHPGSYCGQDAYSDMLVTCKEVFESHSQDARYTQQGDTSPACVAQWGTGGNNMPVVAEKHGFQNTGIGWWSQSEVGATLRTPCGGDSTKANVIAELKSMLHWIVRRLTPAECERLQGYPDGWTDIGDWVDSKGKRHKAADSPRYKALGNSIALPQWWWITCKMAQFLPEHATLGSLFDGIGGFPLVWETRHGKGTAVWASEIEEFPIAVTKAMFPE